MTILPVATSLTGTLKIIFLSIDTDYLSIACRLSKRSVILIFGKLLLILRRKRRL